MHWYTLDPNATDAHEAQLAQWAADAQRRVDPYWLLADRMGYAGFDRSAGTLLPVMIEHDKEVGAPPRVRSRYELAWKAPVDLFSLISQQPDRVRRFQLDAPRALGPRDGTEGGTLGSMSTVEGRPPVVLAAVIDDGLPFAHPKLLARNGGAIVPRFDSIWDQRGTPPGASAQPPWTTSGVPFGARLTNAGMQALVGPTYAGLNEARAYALARYPVQDGRSPHGCGVTHLLAGCEVDLPDGSRRDFASWLATPIVGVQLPRPALNDTAGAWLGFYALAALRHAVDEAGRIANLHHWHLVANLSYGSLAGPHDGSSMFECAVDELVTWARGKKQKLEIVMASGNSRHLPIHAQSTLAPSGSGALRCVVPPDNPRECQIELWLPALDDGGAPLDPTRISATITPPGGAAHAVACGSAHLLRESAASAPCAGVVFARSVAQGLHGTMLTLLVRPTACNGQADRARAGLWRLDVHNAHGSAVTVHARVERNDLVGRTRRAQQVRLEADPLGSSMITADATLSHCAHGAVVLVAGAVQQDTGVIANYTGRGWANGRMRPDWYAPGDRNAALRGVPVPGLLAGQTTRMAGTSIAAAWVSRWLSTGADGAELRPTLESMNQVGPPMQRTVRGA